MTQTISISLAIVKLPAEHLRYVVPFLRGSVAEEGWEFERQFHYQSSGSR